MLKGVNDDGAFDSLTIETELTDDFEVFDSDEEANNFIERAAAIFGDA